MGKHPSEHSSRLVRFQRRWRNFRRWLIAPPVAASAWCLSRLPEPVLRRFNRWTLGFAIYCTNRRSAKERMRTALGPEVSDADLERHFRSMCRCFADLTTEVLMMWRHGADCFDDRIDADEAIATLREGLARSPNGLIGVTGHITNWELNASYIHRHVPPGLGLVFAKRLPNPHLNRMVTATRRKFGLETIFQDENPGRAIRLVRSGGMVGTVPDQDVKTLSGLFIDFFGRPAYTPVGPARLALAARAPMFYSCLLRDGDRLRLEAEILEPDFDAPREEEIVRLTKLWSSKVEETIRAHPGQWLWIHDRWRTTPEKLSAQGRRNLL